MRLRQLCISSMISVTILSAAACGTIKDMAGQRKVDYRSTRTLPPLKIPPELARRSQAPEGLQIPPSPTDQQVVYGPAPVPGPLAGVQPRQTQGGYAPQPTSAPRSARQWLVVPGDAEQRRNQIGDFFAKHGLPVRVDNAQPGVVETDWVATESNLSPQLKGLLDKYVGQIFVGGTRDKFSVQVDPGDQPDTVVIGLAHRGMVQVAKVDSANPTERSWEPRPANNELESEILHLLAEHLGVRPITTTRVAYVQPAAPTTLPVVTPPKRVVLRRSADGVPALSVRDDYTQTWQRIGQSLDRLGLAVEGQNPGDGIYYVRYVDPERPPEKRSFWRKLNPFGRKKKAAPEQYQVKLTRAGSESLVTVRDADGVPDRSETGEKILAMLHEQLR